MDEIPNRVTQPKEYLMWRNDVLARNYRDGAATFFRVLSALASLLSNPEYDYENDGKILEALTELHNRLTIECLNMIRQIQWTTQLKVRTAAVDELSMDMSEDVIAAAQAILDASAEPPAPS